MVFVYGSATLTYLPPRLINASYLFTNKNKNNPVFHRYKNLHSMDFLCDNAGFNENILTNLTLAQMLLIVHKKSNSATINSASEGALALCRVARSVPYTYS